MTTSYHYKGRAVDLRKVDLPSELVDQFKTQCVDNGGTYLDGYSTHIHCSFKTASSSWNYVAIDNPDCKKYPDGI